MLDTALDEQGEHLARSDGGPSGPCALTGECGELGRPGKSGVLDQRLERLGDHVLILADEVQIALSDHAIADQRWKGIAKARGGPSLGNDHDALPAERLQALGGLGGRGVEQLVALGLPRAS